MFYRRLLCLSVFSLFVASAAWVPAAPRRRAKRLTPAPSYQDSFARQVHLTHDAMLRWLQNHPSADGWRNRLQCAEVQQQLERGSQADPEVLKQILRTYSGSDPGLQDRRFVAVRLALRDWVSSLSLTDESPKSPLPAFLREVAERLRPADDAALPFRQHLEDVLREQSIAPSGNPISWYTDYSQACQAAKAQHKLLFIFFHDGGRDTAFEALERDLLAAVAVGALGHRYVWARLKVDDRVNVDGQRTPLLRHAAFAELQGRAGIAIIDYENPAAAHYGYVVSQLPFADGRHAGQRALRTLLELPPGTLTQRTLIFAVRMHPDAPRSAHGLANHVLLDEAEAHARHQASIAVQGHHDWETRFHRINGNLGGDLTSREVVAESWPGESLVQAAFECVNCWRLSDGHWDAVSSGHAEYGYDMKLGSNKVWYATGLFGG